MAAAMSPATRAAVTHTATTMLRLIRRPRGSGKASTLSGDVLSGDDLSGPDLPGPVFSAPAAPVAVVPGFLASWRFSRSQGALSGLSCALALGVLSFGVLPCFSWALSGTPFEAVITAGLPPSAPDPAPEPR